MNIQPMLNENALRGKTVIVTGGGTGLGKSMSLFLSKLGANVVICSRKIEVLQKTATELEKETGGRILPLTCDVRQYSEIVDVIKRTKDVFGQVDALVNNAAGNFISPTERLSHRAFDVIVDIVLKGTYYFTLALGKDWIEEKRKGTFLNIVTTYSWTGSGYVVPSAVAKAGVLNLTRSLAVEWGKYGIRSNAIAPGPFPTEGAWSRLLPGDLAKKFEAENRIPVGRYGEHHELANLACFLVSDFSAFINGEVITIDGGEWLKGAGEFNLMEEVTPEMWDMFEKMRGK